ncbi:hypothetical protein ACJX0J_010301 [Zea mays]
MGQLYVVGKLLPWLAAVQYHLYIAFVVFHNKAQNGKDTRIWYKENNLYNQATENNTPRLFGLAYMLTCDLSFYGPISLFKLSRSDMNIPEDVHDNHISASEMNIPEHSGQGSVEVEEFDHFVHIISLANEIDLENRCKIPQNHMTATKAIFSPRNINMYKNNCMIPIISIKTTITTKPF